MDGPDRLRLLERAVTAGTNSIVISDPNQPDDPLVYVNPAFERTTGYAAEKVLGRSCRLLQGEDRDQPALEELGATLREGPQCTIVLRNYRKNGTLFVTIDTSSTQAGVGLSTMRERVEALAGRIEVESPPGEGTKVALRVPLQADTPTPQRL